MTTPTWGDIRSELLAMAREDHRVRTELAADGSLFDGYHPRMRAVPHGFWKELPVLGISSWWWGTRPP